jgi:predicted Zn-dependent protease
MGNGVRSVWCVALLALGVAEGQQYQPGQGVNFYSKDKEIALGQRLAQDVRQGTTPVDGAAVNDYVKRVGTNLAAHSPGGWTFTFETVRERLGGATDEPVALPGGPIFVAADLIVTAQTEAEFAGMLAHAMAHVVARHFTRQATKEDLGAIQTASLPASAPGTAIPIGMLAFRRAQESEADYLAVKTMTAAGYDPAGLASYLERVQPAPSKNDVMATLPPRDRRIAAIRTEIQKQPAGDYHASDEFDRVQAEIKRLR